MRSRAVADPSSRPDVSCAGQAGSASRAGEVTAACYTSPAFGCDGNVGTRCFSRSTRAAQALGPPLARVDAEETSQQEVFRPWTVVRDQRTGADRRSDRVAARDPGLAGDLLDPRIDGLRR